MRFSRTPSVHRAGQTKEDIERARDGLAAYAPYTVRLALTILDVLCSRSRFLGFDEVLGSDSDEQ